MEESESNLLPGPDVKPFEEIEPRLRLGAMIRRYRVQAGMSLGGLAEKLDMPKVNLSEVERGLASLKAEKLKQVAEALRVLYEPLLIAARDWNRAVFEERGQGGVELTDTTVTERALHGGEELLERELIRCADDLSFVANVARELSIKAEKAAYRARALLAERGVPIPEPPEYQVVECAGPGHDYDGTESWKPHQMRLGVDMVLTYQPPYEEGQEPPRPVYFCSESCAQDFRVVHEIEPPPEAG